jgi:predicted small secreted protein
MQCHAQGRLPAPRCAARFCARDLQHASRKELQMKKFVALLALLMIGVLTGCNTMQGLGKDIERGGEKLQENSKNVQDGK